MLNLSWNPSTLPRLRNFRHDKCPRVGGKYRECCPNPTISGKPEKLDLTPYGNICSQAGQDTLLVQIFNTIGLENKYFVEFGARIPEQLNSSHFRLNCGWEGLLMDGDPGGYPDGIANPQGMDLIKKEFITKENINDVFKKHNVPSKFDLLTIDVDWNDYWLFKALDTNKFSPNVVSIEFSSYFRADEPLVAPYFPEAVWIKGQIQGCSLAALDKLAKSKGYSYICHAEGYHAIFVKTNLLHEEDKNIKIPYKVEQGWPYEMRIAHEKNNTVNYKSTVHVGRQWSRENYLEVEFKVDSDL